MKRTLILSTCLALGACSGSKSETVPDGTPTSGEDIVAACNASAEKAAAEAKLYANVTPSSEEAATAAYGSFLKTIQTWESEDAPCRRDGASVTDRMATSQQVSKDLAAAEKEGTAKLIRHLEPNIDAAREFLKVVFDAGRPLSDEVLDAAHAVDRRYRERLMTKFGETGKYAQLDKELKTTCIFGKQEIDPTQKEITENFLGVFDGRGDVHALCRSPLAAQEYGGDPEGKLVIVLDDDADPSNGVVHEGELGTPEKWKTSQYFKARFEIPQGEPAKASSGYYYVWLKAKRPAMGDEPLASNWFYWHR